MVEKMKIEVWSDIMCPFCYIGKKRLDDTLQSFPDADRIEVEYKSFELQPGYQTHPIRSTAEMLSEIKGIPIAQVKQMFTQLGSMARAENLEMDQSISIPANTVNGHRLSHLAKKYGKQAEAIRALFDAHFAQGRNIDDLDELVKIGEAIGLESGEVRASLESDEFVTDVDNDVREGRNLGVQGVPFFVFDRKYAISGAQQSEVFADTVQKAFEQWAEKHPKSLFQISEGPTCSVDGTCD